MTLDDRCESVGDHGLRLGKCVVGFVDNLVDIDVDLEAFLHGAMVVAVLILLCYSWLVLHIL